MKKIRAWLIRGLVVLLFTSLLGWALRNAPLPQIWLALIRLQGWQIGVILVLNCMLYLLVTLRWWIIVHAQTPEIPFWPLVAVRVAVFGISYFTLGPQVGGEPLQVLALQRKYGLTYSRATASVLMDKLLEFLVNFLLLVIGLAAIFRAGLLAENGPRLIAILVLLGGLLAWPLIHILLMYNHIHPLTFLMRALPAVTRKSKPARFLRVSEWLAGTFCRRHPQALIKSVGVSMLAAAGMLLDYALMLAFLGIDLPFWRVVAGWTAGWLSFLAPLPGGLGALEASQVFALGFFGIPAAAAISVTLLMRARDLIIGGLGLALTGNVISRVK